MSAKDTWFSIDIDVEVRGQYKIDFIYKAGATRATVQPYIGLGSELEELGEPIDMRPSSSAVNVSTLMPGATGVNKDALYYQRTLAASKELHKGVNTFKTVVTANGGNWAHLPVQVIITLISETKDLCPYCDELEEECTCPVCDICGLKEVECSCPVCGICGLKEFDCTCELEDVSIRNRKAKDGKYGIVLENAIVSDVAKFEVKTPNPSQINFRITDALGNTVFESSMGACCPKIVWDLRNNAGRLVGNGTYLVIAEATDLVSRKVYVYYTRVGVKR
jgi:hypothetical protein